MHHAKTRVNRDSIRFKETQSILLPHKCYQLRNMKNNNIYNHSNDEPRLCK